MGLNVCQHLVYILKGLESMGSGSKLRSHQHYPFETTFIQIIDHLLMFFTAHRAQFFHIA